jgi:hypothetical protein
VAPPDVIQQIGISNLNRSGHLGTETRGQNETDFTQNVTDFTECETVVTISTTTAQLDCSGTADGGGTRAQQHQYKCIHKHIITKGVACATIRHVQHGREQGTETNKKNGTDAREEQSRKASSGRQQWNGRTAYSTTSIQMHM